jgi:hypothetical protein
MSTQIQATKAKIDDWDYIKVKNFCTTEAEKNRVKKPPMELEKIFASMQSI